MYSYGRRGTKGGSHYICRCTTRITRGAQTNLPHSIIKSCPPQCFYNLYLYLPYIRIGYRSSQRVTKACRSRQYYSICVESVFTDFFLHEFIWFRDDVSLAPFGHWQVLPLPVPLESKLLTSLGNLSCTRLDGIFQWCRRRPLAPKSVRVGCSGTTTRFAATRC